MFIVIKEAAVYHGVALNWIGISSLFQLYLNHPYWPQLLVLFCFLFFSVLRYFWILVYYFWNHDKMLFSRHLAKQCWHQYWMTFNQGRLRLGKLICCISGHPVRERAALQQQLCAAMALHLFLYLQYHFSVSRQS